MRDGNQPMNLVPPLRSPLFSPWGARLHKRHLYSRLNLELNSAALTEWITLARQYGASIRNALYVWPHISILVPLKLKINQTKYHHNSPRGTSESQMP